MSLNKKPTAEMTTTQDNSAIALVNMSCGDRKSTQKNFFQQIRTIVCK